MPNYPLPPWISGQPSPTEQYTRGVQLGANIAQQQQQLQAQREHAAMAAAVRQQELEQQSIRQQQEVLMQKAYHDAEVGLRERALDQAQQQIQMKTQQAARKAAAQMAYTRRIQAGEDPAKVLLEMGPELGESLAGSAQLYKATRPAAAFTPREVTTPEGTRLFESAPNRFAQVKMPKAATTPQLTEGGIQAVPIYYPGTKTPIKGLAGVPTEGGGYTTRNIPDREVRIAAAQLARMEKGPVGWNLQSEQEPEAEDLKKLYKKSKPEYDRLQRIVSEGGATETPGPVQAPAGGKGRIFTDVSGKRWRYIGTNPDPKSDRNQQNWIEEEGQ